MTDQHSPRTIRRVHSVHNYGCAVELTRVQVDERRILRAAYQELDFPLDSELY